MKKKILGLCMVACLGVTVAGCAADLDDVEKQATKMERVIEEGKIFEKDWAMTAVMGEGEMAQEMSVVRDGENFYMAMGSGEDSIEVWLIKDGDKYTNYSKMGDMKMRETVSADEAKEMLEGFNLKEMYEMLLEGLKELDEECAEDGVTCEFDKNLFGKLTITMTEGEGEEATTSTMVIKGGKVLSADMDGVAMEFEYKNQTVKAPEDKDQYQAA